MGRIARSRWNLDPRDFDASYNTWLDVVVPLVTSAQRSNERLTVAYLNAYITSETGRRSRLKADGNVAGYSHDGRPLREAWEAPPIKAKEALSEGKTIAAATDEARTAAMSRVDMDTYYGARGPMTALLGAASAVTGYMRVTGGNACGACLGAADGSTFATDEVFQFHPNCDCVAEPVIADVPDRVQRATGQEIFDNLSAAEQDRRLGKQAAEAVRGGVPITALVGEAHMENEPDWLVQKPLAAL